MSLFIPPNVRATNSNNAVLPGALWYFYRTGTTELASVYTTIQRTTPHANPVVADAGGMFAPIYLDPSVTYRAVLKTAAGVSVPGGDIDPYVQAVAAADPRSFGVVGGADSAGWFTAPDDTDAWQEWIDYCVENSLPIVCETEIISKVTDTLTIAPTGTIIVPAVGLNVGLPIDLSKVTFVYSGTRDRIVLDIGSAAAYYDDAPIFLPAVIAYGMPVQWPKTVAQLTDTPGSHEDTGIRLQRVRFSQNIRQRLIYGFSKGIEFHSCAFNSIEGAHIYDCQLGRVWTNSGSNHDLDFTNETVIKGGRIGQSGNTSTLGNAFGEVFTWDQSDSYRGNNAHRFIGVCYELGFPASATYRVPVWMDGVGGLNTWWQCRHEGCKGPAAICDGKGSAGSTVYVWGNKFDFIYNNAGAAGAAQDGYILQVNGAYGNIYSGPDAREHHWHSGDLRRDLGSNGGADAPYLAGPCFLMDTSAGTPARALSITGRVATARDAVHLVGCGIFAAIDTTNIKDFRVSVAARNGYEGQLFIAAFDSQGTRLTGNATDATWGNEQYVKGPGLSANAGYGGGYTAGSENITSDVTITVRSEVRKIHIGYIWGGTVLAMQSMSVIGYSTPDCVTADDVEGGMRVFADVDDSGAQQLATAKPDTAGTHGYYAKGQRVGNASAAAGQPGGWDCSTAGWLAAAWGASTAYAPAGRIVTNDSGKMYELTTAGTSAGSGGPTGTTATWDGITDGTAKWRYIGVKAAFVTEPNLA